MDMMPANSKRPKHEPEGVWGVLLALLGAAHIGFCWLLADDWEVLVLAALLGGTMIAVGVRGALRGLQRDRALRRSKAELAPVPTANLPRLQSSSVSASVAVPSSASSAETQNVR